jgi:hypothetical protein
MDTHNNPCGWFDTATFDSDLRVTEITDIGLPPAAVGKVME